MNKRTILTSIAILAALAATALAQPGGGRGGPDDMELGPRMARMLDLSEEQAAAMKALREEGRDEVRTARKELRRLRHDLKGLMLDDDPSADDVRDLTRRIGDLRTDMQVRRAEMRLKMREILTEEQRDRLMTMRERRGGGRFGGRHEGRPGGRHDGSRFEGCDNDGPRGCDQPRDGRPGRRNR